MKTIGFSYIYRIVSKRRIPHDYPPSHCFCRRCRTGLHECRCQTSLYFPANGQPGHPGNWKTITMVFSLNASGKKLYLTDRGKLLLPHAREMIRQFQQLEELMQNQGQSSTLKLGSTLTVGTCLTPSIILDLQKKISGSGCLLFCHQHQEHRAETSPLRTGRCCGRR